jgi:hypothetical protein
LKRTDRIAFHGHLEPRPRFGIDGGLWAIRYPIRCKFPVQGTYSVQVWFFQEQRGDVLKGEAPFAVAAEGIEP